MIRPVVCKLGGELLESPAKRASTADAIARAIAQHARTPLVIVHGGGTDIDAALKAAGIEKRQVDGLRITDEATLEIVVAVLAGSINTHFVAALNTAGVAAVGLTGADSRIGLSIRAPAHKSTSGEAVDLGFVGEPIGGADVRLLHTLVANAYVPVVACIGATIAGALLNVNADTLAAHLAAALGAERLVIAGGTAGVLDLSGRSIPELDGSGIAALVADGTATAGMIAKLRACERAIGGGVADVVIVDGRQGEAIGEAIGGAVPAAATRIAAAPVA